MLRATNTGVTAVIAPDGTVVSAAPEFSMAAVTHQVQGRAGATPYVSAGNYPALALAAALLAAAGGFARRAARSAR
ncbi:Apolipoprotein N-acyltransferase [compost metagenome]